MNGERGESEQAAMSSGKAAPLGAVLKKEHNQIGAVRVLRRQRSGWSSAPAFPVGKPRKKDVAAAPKAPTPGREPTADDLPAWQATHNKEHAEWKSAIHEAHDMNLTGLCFSGGGIRSATFNLGVLQALADLKLLHRFDYLSTVSGGGYIGSWLAAWTKRVGSFGKVQQLLSTNRVQLEDDIESSPIRFLRTYSNYLTPQLGLFSGDTLAMVAIYLRNLLLNQFVIAGLLATVLLVPRALRPCAGYISKMDGALLQGWLGAAEVVLLLVVLLLTTLNLTRGNADKKPKWIGESGTIAVLVASLFSTAVLAGAWLWLGPLKAQDVHSLPGWATAGATAVDGSVKGWFRLSLTPASEAMVLHAVRGAIVYAVIWVCASLLGLVWAKWFEGSAAKAQPAKQPKQAATQGGKDGWLISAGWTMLWQGAVKLIAALATGALAGWLYGLLAQGMNWGDAKDAITFGVPLVVAILLLSATLQIGLLGTGFHDEKREWWGRLGGWLIALGVSWMAVFWVALYFPGFLEQNGHGFRKLAATYLTPAWIVTTLGSVLAGNSKASGNPGEKSTTQVYVGLVAEIGPYVFIAGLVCWMSWLLALPEWKEWNVFVELGLVGAITFFMSWRVDINQFSMHMFYRNRLAGCYLGASNEKRSPNLFTGFDAKDDVALKSFRSPQAQSGPGKVACGPDYDGPYPVLNMSLNLVKGKDLAWQERKAESFVMTPHYCGYDVFLEQQYSRMQMNEYKDMKAGDGRKGDLDLFGYRLTEEYAFPEPFNGPNLGLAMAISGAAASPNMGYYTSTPVAFLLTAFNVRLGQWLGNPRNRRTSRRPTPTVGLHCLLQELFAGTNDTSGYVYLSDGGHFDNMGMYEMVKRRCGLIVVCDAEADENYGFEGLGNAIKRCRIDLGIGIDIDTKPIMPDESGMSKQHYALGKIHYEQADMHAPVGHLIYIKASLTGDEPTDVTTYKKRHSTFPHESTADQWFSESQFESYRRLGYSAIACSVKEKRKEGGEIYRKDVLPILTEFGFETPGVEHGPARP